MKLESDGFLHRRAMPTRYAFGRHRFYPRELKDSERFELSDNRSPHLSWSEAPEGTKSFALICHDPDVPSTADDVNKEGKTVSRELARTRFHHWVLVDLPADQRELSEGAFSDGVTAKGKSGPTTDGPARQGLNDYTSWFAGDSDMEGKYFGYDGPCPPWNDELIHWYVFTLYALDVDRLEVEGEFDAAAAQQAMEGHILAEATLEGFYYIYPEARFR